jgi:hypothetical protein
VKKKISTSRDELHKAQEAHEKVIAELEKKLAQSKKKTDAAAPRTKGKKSNMAVTAENKALVDDIKDKTDLVLFALVKFIADDHEEKEATKMLIDYGDLPHNFVDTEEKRMHLSTFFRTTSRLNCSIGAAMSLLSSRNTTRRCGRKAIRPLPLTT